MKDEPVYFGLIPVGNVTLKSDPKNDIFKDYCGNSSNITQENNCD